MAHGLPTQEELDAMNNEWIEPYDAATAPVGFEYALYETKSRGASTQGSYWYKLPEGYSADKKYPVLIWLHGGMSRAGRHAHLVRDHYVEGMAKGKMPPTILVLPQALPVGWYLNSIDNKFLIEDVMVKDFIPHIDATFSVAEGLRGIEGFSMGGYGAAHLGFKFPHLFRAVSPVAAAILPSLSMEPKERVWDTFRDSQEYYDACHPKTLLKQNKEQLQAATLRVRLLSGGDDVRLADAIEVLSQLMTEAHIVHYRKDIAGAGHEYDMIVKGLGEEAWDFWKQAFEA
ncbi:hypothetical protein SEUCBS139899_001001 [Sporothrix eucalyptigena]